MFVYTVGPEGQIPEDAAAGPGVALQRATREGEAQRGGAGGQREAGDEGEGRPSHARVHRAPHLGGGRERRSTLAHDGDGQVVARLGQGRHSQAVSSEMIN